MSRRGRWSSKAAVTDARGRSPEFGKCVYFIADEEYTVVKIGKTDRLKERFRQLAANCCVPLELVTFEAGVYTAVEEALHTRFYSYRLRSEWFEYAGSLAIFIDQLVNQEVTLESEFRDDIRRERAHAAWREEILEGLNDQ